MIGTSIRGIQQAQQAMEKAYNAVQPQGALGRAVKVVTAGAHRAAVANTPWDSGGLRAAHRMRLSSHAKAAMGVIDIDPSQRNPRQNNQRPYEYGARLHNQGIRPGRRGGVRAFYEYTVQKHGMALLRAGGAELHRGLP